MEVDLAHFFDNVRFTICPERQSRPEGVEDSGQIATLPFPKPLLGFFKTQFYRKNGTQLMALYFPEDDRRRISSRS